MVRSSPRTWRCFFEQQGVLEHEQVFSTYVEVFPSTISRTLILLGLLHVRGGVSHQSIS